MIEFYDRPKLELYNLKEDISEKNNLADKMPEKTAKTIMHTPNPDHTNAK